METFPKLCTGAASLLWPLIVIFLCVRFMPVLGAVVESAKSRKFTLKIGGQELTMEEANQAQQKLIVDLQTQVCEIQKALNAPTPAAQLQLAGSVSPWLPRVPSILWVDDNPKNNSYFIQQLSEWGVKVDLAQSTSEGSARFKSQQYDYVISDMGRKEGDGHNFDYNPTAGLDLLKLVREKDPRVPFVIFCSAHARREYGHQALNLGATAVTSSPTEFFGILDLAVTGNSS